jgi:hypothetical protein
MQDAWRACFFGIARAEPVFYTIFTFLFLQVITQTHIWHHQSKADPHEDG